LDDNKSLWRTQTVFRVVLETWKGVIAVLLGFPFCPIAVSYTSPVAKDTERTMPIMGHLGELRRRLTWVAVVVVVFVIAAFVEKKWVFFVVMKPLRDNTAITELTTLGVTEAFMSVLKVCIYAGLICALPFILYQFWAFILPGLYENERRSVLPYMLSTTALFLGGVAFAYFVVLPVGLRFMIGYAPDIFHQLLQADRYVTFISMFLLAFGVVFELPIVMMLLAWARIVDHVRLRKVRRYAILVEAIVAAVFTPSQDPLSMCLMLIPLIILYEVGIWLAKVSTRRRAKREQLAEEAEAAREAGEAEVTQAAEAEGLKLEV
jgi:sec-independent protein translocase protein TatC